MQMAIWNPIQNKLVHDGQLKRLKLFYGKVIAPSMKTLPLQIFKSVREEYPDMKIIVHPECTQ